MKKTLLSAVAAAVLIAAPALAADLPARGPVYKAPEVFRPAAYNWTGFYVGGNVGYGWENTQTQYNYSSTTVGVANPGFEDIFGPVSVLNAGGPGPLNVGGSSAVNSAVASGFLPTSLGRKNAGYFTGGLQAGYNYQISQFVLGGEADFNWMNGVKTTQFVAPPNGFISNTTTSQAGLKWLGTVRARAGWAMDRALIYATGGLAYGSVVATTNASGTDGFTTDVYSGSGSKTKTGYTVGGGLEYGLTPNWTAKAEYLYYNLGTVNYAVAAANSVAAGEGLFINAKQKFDGSIVRLGVNYKFGG